MRASIERVACLGAGSCGNNLSLGGSRFLIENLKPGTVVDDRYSIVEFLGVGGMGYVYLAIETSVDRKVALKFLHPGLIADEESFSRFEREGQVLSQLSHPGILTFYRFGLWNPTPTPSVFFPFIAMEYLDGSSLRSILDEHQRLAPDKALNIVEQLCEALASAHKLNVVHRDLKPNNVMLMANMDSDVIKVLDFGLAKFCRTPDEQSQHLTQTGNLVGSVHYMSPEQSTGRVVDARSDIYSVGCLLYELLTGAPPFNADSAVGILYLHANEHPLLASDKVRDLPPGTDALIGKAMEKLTEARYQSMSQFLHDIKLVRSGGGEVLGRPDRKKSNRSGLRVLVLAAVSVVTYGAYALLDYRGHINPPDLKSAHEVGVAKRNDGASLTSNASLEELTRSVLRAERRFDQAARLGQSTKGPADLLYQNLLQVIDYYALRGRYDEALTLLPRIDRCADSCNAADVKHVVIAYVRNSIYRSEFSLEPPGEKKEQLRRLTVESLVKGDELSKKTEDPFHLLQINIRWCSWYLYNEKLSDAEVSFAKALALLSEQDPGVSVFRVKRWESSGARSALSHLIRTDIVLSPTASTAAVVTYAEMVTKLALATKVTNPSALVTARTCVENLFESRLPHGPTDAEQRKRYLTVLKLLKDN